MSDIKMSVVNSTVGLGETEYSLCDNKGMLKYDKPALDECCEIINSHDTMQARITELETALTNIKKHQETVIVGMPQLSSVWQIASRALEK